MHSFTKLLRYLSGVYTLEKDRVRGLKEPEVNVALIKPEDRETWREPEDQETKRSWSVRHEDRGSSPTFCEPLPES